MSEYKGTRIGGVTAGTVIHHPPAQPAQGVGLTDIEYIVRLARAHGTQDMRREPGKDDFQFTPAQLVNFGRAILARQTAPTLPKAQIDSIVYQCRQSGDDSTYAIVNAALAAACQTAPTLDSAPQANRADFERLWMDEQENMTPAQIEAAWSAWQVAAGKSAPQQPAAERADLLAEACTVFDLMLDGCPQGKFGDYENGHGEAIGPRMDALHARLRSLAAAPSPAPVAKEGNVKDAFQSQGAPGSAPEAGACPCGFDRIGCKHYNLEGDCTHRSAAANAVALSGIMAQLTTDMQNAAMDEARRQYGHGVTRSSICAIVKAALQAAPTRPAAEKAPAGNADGLIQPEREIAEDPLTGEVEVMPSSLGGLHAELLQKGDRVSLDAAAQIRGLRRQLFDYEVQLDALKSLRRPAAEKRDALSGPLQKWIDDAKGKDPFTDDLIAEIERLRQELWCAEVNLDGAKEELAEVKRADKAAAADADAQKGGA